MTRKLIMTFFGLILLVPTFVQADIAAPPPPPRKVPYLNTDVPQSTKVIQIGIGITMAMVALTFLLWRWSNEGAIVGLALVMISIGFGDDFNRVQHLRSHLVKRTKSTF